MAHRQRPGDSSKILALSDDKLMCRINIKTDGRFWRYLRWRDFCDKYHADPALRWLHSSSQHPITQTGTSVNRRFLWPTLPRLNFWIRTDFTRKRIRFLDSRLRMWRRSVCVKESNKDKQLYFPGIPRFEVYRGFLFIPSRSNAILQLRISNNQSLYPFGSMTFCNSLMNSSIEGSSFITVE